MGFQLTTQMKHNNSFSSKQFTQPDRVRDQNDQIKVLLQTFIQQRTIAIQDDNTSRMSQNCIKV